MKTLIKRVKKEKQSPYKERVEASSEMDQWRQNQDKHGKQTNMSKLCIIPILNST